MEPHPLFQRDGNHLLLEVPITYAQAALGATIEVPTLQGRTELPIPGSTQSGTVFRLRGQGMPGLRGQGSGDLLVRTVIEVPKRLTKRQKSLLRELAEEEQSHVSPERKSFLEKLAEYFLSAGDDQRRAGE
jgi:molecular chaperone DnaJ